MGNTSEEVYLNLRSSEDSFQLVLTDVSPLQKAVKDRQWVRRPLAPPSFSSYGPEG